MEVRKDPCGIACAVFTYLLFLYADYVVISWLIAPIFSQSLWGVFHVVNFNVILFLAIFAHIRAMITDPGIVPISKAFNSKNKVLLGAAFDVDVMVEDESDSDPESSMISSAQCVGHDWTVCVRCQSYRPPRAHHCRICRRCVRKMDHHCPWINNCVGEFNQKYFIQFLFYVGLLSIYALGLVVNAWLWMGDWKIASHNTLHGQRPQQALVFHTVLLTIESVLFGLFVMAVSCDQIQAIFRDETAIEAVKRRNSAESRTPSRSKRTLLREVCGNGSVLFWMFPCSSIPSKRDLVRLAQRASLSGADLSV